VFDPVAIYTARWIESADAGKLESSEPGAPALAVDHSGALVYSRLARESRADARALAGIISARRANTRQPEPPFGGWCGARICAT